MSAKILLLCGRDEALLSSGNYTYAALKLAQIDLPQYDMNPAHIIRECLTDPDWGMQRLLAEQERAAADWAWQHEQAAGLGTGTLPGGRWWWWPLLAQEGPLALLGVSPKDQRPLAPEQRRLLAALAQPLAQALERAQLAQELEAARLHGQTEELRSALKHWCPMICAPL